MTPEDNELLRAVATKFGLPPDGPVDLSELQRRMLEAEVQDTLEPSDGLRVVDATVTAALIPLGIVRLQAGTELFAFGPNVEGAIPVGSVKVGDRLKLHVGPRLNKVYRVERV